MPYKLTFVTLIFFTDYLFTMEKKQFFDEKKTIIINRVTVNRIYILYSKDSTSSKEVGLQTMVFHEKLWFIEMFELKKKNNCKDNFRFSHFIFKCYTYIVKTFIQKQDN